MTRSRVGCWRGPTLERIRRSDGLNAVRFADGCLKRDG
jgi:hypothetical protein